jgi:hypothetical protein
MITKLCSKCKNEKDINLFVLDSRRSTGHGAKCRECANLDNSKYRKEHREQGNNYQARWVKNNPEKFKEMAKKRDRKERLLLKRVYVIGKLISGSVLKFSDITTDLIELKRAQIQLTREIKKCQSKLTQN